MRKLVVFAALAALVAAFFPNAPHAHGAGSVYYVGGSGASDGNSGTAYKPFATIQKAAQTAQAGDTVKIRGGVYREMVTPANSGAEGKPIVFEPDGDAVVTVSGADEADGGWSVYKGNIYEKSIKLPSAVYNDHMTDNKTLMANQVFVDGKMMIEARWPNVSYSDDLMNRADWRDGSIGTWTPLNPGMTLDDSAIPDIEGGWKGATMWITGWFISQSAPVVEQKGSELRIDSSVNDAKFREFYYLTGKLGALDSAKEWFYDGEKLYLWAPDGKGPSNVEVKTRNYAFDLSGKSDIAIRNINVFAASLITDDGSKNIAIDGMKAKYINHSVTVPGPNTTYSHTDETGIRLIGEGSSIRNSTVEYGSGQGIVLGTGNTADNNLVHDVAYDGTYASGIVPVPGMSDQKITHNTIFRTGRSSINMLNNKNVEIAYNDMYDYSLSSQDAGAVYSSMSSDLTGTHLHHNWIHDSQAEDGAEGIQTGIYFDQGSGPATVDHNVVWNNMTDYYNQHEDGADKVFETYNNTFGSLDNASYTTYQNPPKDISTNNIYRDAILSVDNATYAIRYNTDPKFTGEGHGGLKYRLQEGSPAVDAGKELPGVTDGFKGKAPDIGAYEIGGEDWVAGYTAPGWEPGYYAAEKPLEPFSLMPRPPSDPGTIAVDDWDTGTDENQYAFTGLWAASANPQAYMETDHYTATKDDHYEMKFNGIQVSVYGEKNNSFGILAISVDGGEEAYVDAYSETRMPNTLLYASPELTAGSHTVKVRVTEFKNEASGGTFTTADRIVVRQSGKPDPATVSLPKPKPAAVQKALSAKPETEPDPGVKYEAEKAKLKNGAEIDTDHTDFSGTGFLGGFGNAGATATFTVDAPAAGLEEVTLRYGNGNPVTTLSVYLNGEKVRQIGLPATGSWDAWGYHTEQLKLVKGENAIAYKYDQGDTGAVNLDYIAIPFDNGREPGPGTKYEAEKAKLESGAEIDTDHNDFSGTGFLGGYGTKGATATFTVNQKAAGSKDVTLRYGNGNDTSSLSILVNGNKIKQTLLPGTGSWDQWGYRTSTLQLKAGDNTISYKNDTDDGGAVNLDYISVADAVNPTFADIAHNWAKTAIEGLAADRVFFGMKEQSFKPSDSVTRADLASMIARALKLPEPKSTEGFADIPDYVAAKSDIYAAAEAGIMSAKSEDHFSPNDPVSREETAVILLNAYLHATGKMASDIDVSTAKSFGDANAIDAHSAEAVRIGAALGWINGYKDGTFKPAREINRAEAATVVFRLLDDLSR